MNVRAMHGLLPLMVVMDIVTSGMHFVRALDIGLGRINDP